MSRRNGRKTKVRNWLEATGWKRESLNRLSKTVNGRREEIVLGASCLTLSLYQFGYPMVIIKASYKTLHWDDLNDENYLIAVVQGRTHTIAKGSS